MTTREDPKRNEDMDSKEQLESLLSGITKELRDNPSIAGPVRQFTIDLASRVSTDETSQDARSLPSTLPLSILAEGTDTKSASYTLPSHPEYEFLCEIARGGMGVVYKARQKRLNRFVALKMILTGDLAGDMEVQRFRSEAEAAAKLDHPCIVPVYETGEFKGHHFFSMGFVDGETLSSRAKRQMLTPIESAKILIKVAGAIEYAHENGVVHRDLKPANILLDGNDGPKVTDFGLAKQLASDSDLTRTGAVMGTPSYMPPEQAAGNTSEVGPRSDVYSLGAVLYFLLSGRPPFQSANHVEVLMQVLENEPIPTRTLAPDVPKDLDTICQKCLEKDPNRRYESAQAFSDDLIRFVNDEPVFARPIGRTERAWRWSRKHQAATFAIGLTCILLLLLGIGGPFVAIERQFAAQRAKTAEGKARKSEAATHALNSELKSQVSRNKYFLANARWDVQRVLEARKLLEGIPAEHRHLEWQLTRRQIEGSDFTCYGHMDSVERVAYSPDENKIVSASSDGTYRIWDAVSGTELANSKLKMDDASIPAISRSGRLIASIRGNEVDLWDVSTATLKRTLSNTRGEFSDVCLSESGDLLATSSFDGVIAVWDTETTQQLCTLDGDFDLIADICFAPDGLKLVTSGFDGRVLVWSTTDGSLLSTAENTGRVALSVRFSPSGKQVAGGCDDWTVCFWDVNSGELEGTLVGHDAPVTAVAYRPDGVMVLTGSSDNTIRTWDARSFRMLETRAGHVDTVNDLAFHSGCQRMVSASDDGTVRVWSIDSGSASQVLRGHRAWASEITTSVAGNRVVSASYDQTVRVWDAISGKELHTLEGHPNPVSCVSISSDGSRVVSGDGIRSTEMGCIKVWDVENGSELMTLTDDVVGGVRSIAFSPDGIRIAAGVGGGPDESSGAVRIWDVQTGIELPTLRGHNNTCSSVKFSPDGARIASGSRDKTVRIWDAFTGELLETRELPYSVLCLAYSKDGSFLAAGGSDGMITAWNQAGDVVLALDGHAGRVRSLCFSPDSSRLISGSVDQTIRVWDVATGEELKLLTGDLEGVTGVSMTEDGNRVIASGTNGNLVMWAFGPSQEVRVLDGHTNDVVDVWFSPDGSRLYSCSTSFDWASRDWKDEQRAWNPLTGEPIANDEEGPSDASLANRSPDGSLLAVSSGKQVLVVNLAFKAEPHERLFRESKALPSVLWHEIEGIKAEESNDFFGAAYHYAWLLVRDPNWKNAYERLHVVLDRLTDDERLELPAMVQSAVELPEPE